MINNETSMKGDVYYYTPQNRKLRSLVGIQKYLDKSLNNDNLTLDNFTFEKKPIGMNDNSKELIREANQKSKKVIKTIINM